MHDRITCKISSSPVSKIPRKAAASNQTLEINVKFSRPVPEFLPLLPRISEIPNFTIPVHTMFILKLHWGLLAAAGDWLCGIVI
jgi:hypothetical protein